MLRLRCAGRGVPTCCRAFAVSSGGCPKLKRQLQRFYLLVHPDLFGNDSEVRERDANSTSLKYVLSYLEDIKTCKSVQGADLEFYIRSEEDAGFKVVRHKLSSCDPSSALKNMQRELPKLFEKLGLDSNFEIGDFFKGTPRELSGDAPMTNPDAAMYHEPAEGSLLDLLSKDTLDRARYFMQRAREYSVERDIVQASLSHSGVRVVFDSAGPPPIAAEASLLKEVVVAVEQAGIDVQPVAFGARRARSHTRRKMTLHLDAKNVGPMRQLDVPECVDSMGRVHLKDGASDNWGRIIKEVINSGIVEEKTRNTKWRQAEVGALREAMQVRHLFTTSSLEEGAAFKSFVSRMKDSVARGDFREVSDGRYHELPVHLWDSEKIHADFDNGVLRMPIRSHPGEILSALRKYGGELTETARLLQATAEKEHSLLSSARHACGLKSLRRAPNLESGWVSVFCASLLRDQRVLLPKVRNRDEM